MNSSKTVFLACVFLVALLPDAETRPSLSFFGRSLLPGRGGQADLIDLIEEREPTKSLIGGGSDCVDWGYFWQHLDGPFHINEHRPHKCCEGLVEREACSNDNCGWIPEEGAYRFYRHTEKLSVCIYCGDGFCEHPLECRLNCPEDCNRKPLRCGDVKCGFLETHGNCPEDCGDPGIWRDEPCDGEWPPKFSVKIKSREGDNAPPTATGTSSNQSSTSLVRYSLSPFLRLFRR
jgi:hypothetical protein